MLPIRMLYTGFSASVPLSMFTQWHKELSRPFATVAFGMACANSGRASSGELCQWKGFPKRNNARSFTNRS